MKTIRTATWMAALAVAAGLAANAQGPGGQGAQGGPPGGGNGQAPSAEEVAKRLLADFDADQDGKLNADELKKSIEKHQQGRPAPGGQQMRRPTRSPGGPQARTQGGRGEQQGGAQAAQGDARPARPQPAQMAARWVEEFDADKNGSLSPQELQKAMEAHRPPPPPRDDDPDAPQGGPREAPPGEIDR